MATTGGGKRQAPVKYTCGTPKSECTGAFDPRFGTLDKLHSSPTEAKLCMRRHLMASGYIQIGTNVWLSADPAEALKVT